MVKASNPMNEKNGKKDKDSIWFPSLNIISKIGLIFWHSDHNEDDLCYCHLKLFIYHFKLGKNSSYLKPFPKETTFEFNSFSSCLHGIYKTFWVYLTQNSHFLSIFFSLLVPHDFAYQASSLQFVIYITHQNFASLFTCIKR